VFSDTLGLHREFSLAREAVHPLGIVRMATPPAVRSFSEQWLAHPIHLASAALWAFGSDRRPEIEMCARFGLPCHVLWAARDTILSRKDGQDFARQLHATFTVAKAPPGYGPIDHDWMFDDPELFVQHLDALGLRALAG
jgi:pimeloyl-ACP methyl ester carboxylesterase